MIVTILVTCILLIVVLYFLSIRKYKYWKLRGVKYDKGKPFFGSIGDVHARKLCFSEYVKELYQKYPKERLVGFYINHGGYALVVRDPKLIKHIMETDFEFFHPRALNVNRTISEPMLENLFFADGSLWKLLRKRLMPAFSSEKVKEMFYLVVERTESLQLAAMNLAVLGAQVDFQNLMARYSIDVIGACGFGIDTESLNDNQSQYTLLGRRMLASIERDAVVAFMKWTFPDANQCMFNLPPEIEKEIVVLVKSVIQKRNYKPSGRNDFIDSLLLKAEDVVGESMTKLTNNNPDGMPETVNREMDEKLMAAQAFMFFAAGFETISTATSFTLHQLAMHPDKQIKCQQEIDKALARHNGKPSYKAVQEMKYLHMCLKESMRLLPSMGFLLRQCVKPYTFPGTNVSINAGVNVLVSLQGLHNDKQYFEAPEQFQPERFSEGAIIPDYVYMPFGVGPRTCIGQQFGEMQSLAGLAALLSLFSVTPCTTTRRPIIDQGSFIFQRFRGGLPLSLIRRRFELQHSEPKGVNEKKTSGIRLTEKLFRRKIRLEKIPT